MASTVVVLVVLIVGPLGWIPFLVAHFLLAKRYGQSLKSVSWSIFRGFTAEFYKDSERDT